MISLLDIAWAAGIWEGEGSLRRAIYTAEAQIIGKQNRTFRVSVVQKDREILYRLKEKFGGQISPAESGCSQWNVSGAAARGFLMTIYSFLSKRRKEQVKQAGLFDPRPERHLSEEHRQKIGESGKRAWTERKQRVPRFQSD